MARTLVNTVTLTSGSGTYTVPEGVNEIDVTVIGGGGAGGGSNNGSGGGGKGGGCAFATRSVVLDQEFSYSVGAAGTGVSDGKGNTGGTSTFDDLSALGGEGGTQGGNGPGGTTGGTATGGDVNTEGGDGANGLSGSSGGGGGGGAGASPDGDGANGSQAVAGVGGAGGVGVAPGGTGGKGANDNTNTNATAVGAIYGAGGGGASRVAASPQPGGNGAAGVIIIEEYLDDTVDLTANDLDTGAVVLGSPALTQVYMLVANDLTMGAVTLGSPELTEYEPPTELTADDLTMGPVDLGSPALTQVHYLTADPLTMGAISLGEPQLVFMADLGVLSLSVLPAAAAYDVGDLLDLQASFAAIGGAPVDPDSVRFLMRDPAGELTTYVYGEDVEVQRLNTGLYSVRWSVEMAGPHWWRYEGVGAGQAAEEKRTLVNVSRVLG
ncbi:glycine-rich domain-containing protein [Marinibaculum pumilum]|uniref:Glycine-rich domain-containing protein n=1 Tax=Marinibaculum pumilum TaxID=1766165 RepID=A0ABV7KYZ0_9PROT